MSVGFLLTSLEQAVIWKAPRKDNMIKQFLLDVDWGEGELDYLIVDTPPGTSDEHLSVIAALKNCKPDGAILVTTPQDLSVDMIKKELNFCQKMKLSVIGVIENMNGFVCPCCGEVTKILGSKESISEKLNGVKILGSIALDHRICLGAENGEITFLDNIFSVQYEIVNNILTILGDV